ncbi:unnamed protein product [Bursaphelenchus xylophilus]|uniref:(pine wood nematode) hypothetical protein n=1 Tax=Bursaphelenchus xylophilus TaxID=6326 RepID=A0A1I7S1S1_BURXY|nr:unnamed protein product [Bursaphelenchus xylophilus]CAG9089863.1 unnamed protein product [Bursaphelenchus xylophilus]
MSQDPPLDNPDQPNGSELVVAQEQVIDNLGEDQLVDPPPVAATEDVYEFKEDPDDSLVVPEVLRPPEEQPDTSGIMETEDDEAEMSQEDAGNDLEPELNDSADGQLDSNLDEVDEVSGRRVPPLRIQLPKDEEDEFEDEDPGRTAGKEAKTTPKKPVRTQRKTTEKRGASGRITRSSTRQTTKKEQKSPADAGSAKRPRTARRSAVRETPARALDADNSLTVGLSPTPQASMPNSPEQDEESRSSGADSAVPILSLQPDRLSDEIYALYDHSDISRRLTTKEMMIKRWKSDLERQQQPWKTADYTSVIDRIEPRLAYSTVCQYLSKAAPFTDKSSMKAMMASHDEQYQTLKNRQHAERQRLMEQIERQTLRELNFIRQRSTNAITAIRILNDAETLNANRLDERSDEAIKQIGVRSRSEIVKELKDRFRHSTTQLFNRHRFEADTIFQKQKDEWQRFVMERMPSEVRSGVENPVIKELYKDLKRVEPRKVDLDMIIY